MISLAFPRPESGAPVAAPVAPTDGRDAALVSVLEAAAAALTAAAQALGAGPARHSPTPTPPPAPAPAAPAAPPARPAFTLSLTEAINEFMVAKARAGRSDRYLRQLRVSLSSFARGRGQVPIGQLYLADVETWLHSKNWSARTRAGYLSDLCTLWNWCLRRGYVPDLSPVLLDKETVPPDGPPSIHTPAQVAAVLEAARREPDVLRHLAVRYFAGVRSSESHRLREENILRDRGVIEIPAVKAKTRRRRLVPISPALAAWLDLGGTLRPIRPDTIRRVIRSSGVPWPKNVARHSFVSYHLAQHQNAGKTALEAGHSEQILFAHYRETVTAQDAAAFWALRPA